MASPVVVEQELRPERDNFICVRGWKFGSIERSEYQNIAFDPATGKCQAFSVWREGEIEVLPTLKFVTGDAAPSAVSIFQTFETPPSSVM